MHRRPTPSTKRPVRAIAFSRILFGLGYGILLSWTTSLHLAAQDAGSAQNPSDTAMPPSGAPPPPPPGTPGVPINPSGSDNGSAAAENPSNAADNPSAINTPPVPIAIPNNPALFYNPNGVPSNPLLPQQGSNGLSETQAQQLTTPSLFTTGNNNLAQVATDTALMRAFSQEGAAGFYSEPGVSYSHGPLQELRLGPVVLKTALTTTVVADDNLLIGQEQGTGGKKFSDTSYSVTPAVLLEYGEEEGQKGFASITYAPSFTRFLHYSAENSDNQNLLFNASYPFQRLTLNVSEAYSQSSGVNQDTDTRTTQTTQISTGGGSYAIDDKLSVGAHIQQATTTFSQGLGQGDQTTSVDASLNYQFSDKLTFGPSVNVGQDKPQGGQGSANVPGGGNQLSSNFEQALLGADYLPTAKISVTAQAGLEFQQYDQGGGDTTEPIFAAGIGYTPFDSTSLSLNAFRNERTSSADSDQTVTSIGVGASVTQRLFQRFYLNFSVSYEHDNYAGQGNDAGSTPSYTENSTVYRPSLAFNPTEWISMALYYQYENNEAQGFGTNYHDNQVGLSVSAEF
jgi:hypothetical protein